MPQNNDSTSTQTPTTKPSMILVYLAGPITKGNQFNNVHNAIVAAKRLRDAGFAVLVPHRCALDEIVLGEQDYEKWMEEDFEYIRRSDVLVRLPGVSSGSDREVDYAWERNMPFFIPYPRPPHGDPVQDALQYKAQLEQEHPICATCSDRLHHSMFGGAPPEDRPAFARVDRTNRRLGTLATYLCQEHYEKNPPEATPPELAIKRRDVIL